MNFVLFDKSAHGHHVGHARYLANRAFDHPVLQGAKFRSGLAITSQTVSHHLTHWGGVRSDVGLNAWRQVNAAQPLVDLLSDQIDVGLVVISDHCERQTKLRVREHADGIGDARQGDLNRQGHLFFDFFSSTPRVERNDGDLCVCNVWEGFNRQSFEGKQARHGEQHGAQHNEERLVQCVMDQFSHLDSAGFSLSLAVLFAASSAMRNSRANNKLFSLTTSSPASKPLDTIEMLVPS